VSQFTRTRQTAELILGPGRSQVVNPDLNEIKYGCFEGTPWMAYVGWLRQMGPSTRPPGGGEARREAVQRVLCGLTACLSAPGPRLVVGHGLMISVLLQLLQRKPIDVWDLPEGPYVRPLLLDDARLRRIIDAGLDQSAALPEIATDLD